ncbi:protein of unknown function [Aminobacter niigataensis]|nr:protein of unknown function [Aminobacter niigataensis]
MPPKTAASRFYCPNSPGGFGRPALSVPVKESPHVGLMDDDPRMAADAALARGHDISHRLAPR